MLEQEEIMFYLVMSASIIAIILIIAAVVKKTYSLEKELESKEKKIKEQAATIKWLNDHSVSDAWSYKELEEEKEQIKNENKRLKAELDDIQYGIIR